MEFNFGDRLWRYTARDNKFNVREGIVQEYDRYKYRRAVVRFDRYNWDLVPKPEQIGVVRGHGPMLWLTERNDALARKLFLEYELEKLDILEKQLERKKQLIETLREGMEDDE